jgi:ABC-type transport system involved in multi-copper enzyme maturation permease subunit
MAVIVMMAAMLGALFQATACIGREREERTLDMLLTLPIGRDEVLASKWLGSALSGRWLLLGLLVVLLLGMIARALHPSALPAIVVAAAVHVAFATSLGLYLSVATASTGRAAMIAMAVLLAACLVPVVFCAGGLGAVPPVAWVMCLPRKLSESPWEGSPETAHALVIGLFAYGCLAWVFWLLAVRRFHRDVDRGAVVA